MKSRTRNDFEHQEQKAFFEWFNYAYPDVLAWAHPSGGKRDIGTAIKLKAEGVKAGVPDIMIADGKPGLFIEMKRKDGGRVSEAQKETLKRLHDVGYRVAVCHGWEEAKTAAEFYLKDHYKNGNITHK